MLARTRRFVRRLRSPLGRRTLVPRLEQAAWPLMRRAAALHRRTVGRNCRVVGVTGSLGKSTATRAVMAAVGLPPSHATPHNARSMIANVVLGVRPSDRYVVAEVGIAEPGTMAVYSQMVRPDIAVVTLVATDHHQSMGDLLTTRREKCRLVEGLPRDGLAVLNGDDPNVLWMAERTRARVITFGFGEHCDVRAVDAQLDWPRGTRLRICVDGTEYAATVRLIGRHTAYAVLAGLAIAVGEGLDVGSALDRLACLAPTTERMQVMTLPNGAHAILDTMKGSIESFHAALDTLAEVQASQRVAVLGEIEGLPGKRPPAYRDLGRRAARAADLLFTISSYDARYSSGAKSAGMTADAIIKGGHHAVDALEDLRALVQPGDAVLIKGRGSQRLARLALALAGRDVRCWIDPCSASSVRCCNCPMLERGWEGLPEVL